MVVTYLSTKTARIFAVLGNFHFFNHFTEGGPITGTVFPYNSDLFGTLGLQKKIFSQKIEGNT